MGGLYRMRWEHIQDNESTIAIMLTINTVFQALFTMFYLLLFAENADDPGEGHKEEPVNPKILDPGADHGDHGWQIINRGLPMLDDVGGWVHNTAADKQDPSHNDQQLRDGFIRCNGALFIQTRGGDGAYIDKADESSKTGRNIQRSTFYSGGRFTQQL